MKGKAAETFEDMHIYQRARELTNAIYSIPQAQEYLLAINLRAIELYLPDKTKKIVDNSK